MKPLSIQTRASGPVVGIDLGTTHSLVAMVQDGKPQILPTVEGKNLLPSVLHVSSGGKLLELGYSAKALRSLPNAENVVFSIKRLLGRGEKDFEKLSREVSYPLKLNAEGRILAQIGDYTLDPIEASSWILRSLKESAEKKLGVPVHQAVVTVPAYFNDGQRQATRLAGKMAGLEVLRILNEPTAAALAYGYDKTKEQKILIFDLGGGTFDVSILKIEKGIIEVLSTHGDTQLGGDDWDRAILKAAGVSSPNALTAAEEWKISWSKRGPSAVTALKEDLQNHPLVFSGKDYFLNPEIFQHELQHLEERIFQSLSQALKDSALTPAELDEVLLVGGSTRLPWVRELVARRLGKTPNTSLNPDEVVALGAALQADVLSGKNREMLLLDVIPLSLGIETYGGLMGTLISRNTRIPTRAIENYTNFIDFQTGVDLHILQGESEKAAENRSLAKLKLKGLRPERAGQVRVEVEFLVDADGILQISARDLKGESTVYAEIQPAEGISDQDLEELLRRNLNRTEASIAQDLEYKQWVETSLQAEPVLRAVEKHLKDAESWLERSQYQKLVSKVDEMKSALIQKDSAATQRLKYELEELSRPVAERLLSQVLK